MYDIKIYPTEMQIYENINITIFNSKNIIAADLKEDLTDVQIQNRPAGEKKLISLNFHITFVSGDTNQILYSWIHLYDFCTRYHA